MKTIIARLSFIFICSATVAFSSEENIDYYEVEINNLEQYRVEIEKVREKYELPGLAIALVDYSVLPKEANYELFGLRNIELNEPVTEETMFRLASISKMFIALSVLKLVEEGKLNLNDELKELAPEIEFNNPWSENHPIRLVHLLEHTTGWDDMHLAEWLPAKNETISPKEFLAIHPHTRASRWPPGSRYSYTNISSPVSAYIVERVTGQDFEDYVKENFFVPLEMTDSSYVRTDAFRERGATKYVDGKAVPYWMIGDRAAGSVNADIVGLSNFMLMLINNGEFKGKRIISEESIRRMEMPLTSLYTVSGLELGYGLHNYISESRTYDYHGHDGGLPGLMTRLSYDSENKKGYIIFANGESWEGYRAIQILTQNYLGRDFIPQELIKPEVIEADLAEELSGYYRVVSPRHEMGAAFTHFLLSHWFKVENNTVLMDSWILRLFAIDPFEYFRIGENKLRDEYSNKVGMVWFRDELGDFYIQSAGFTFVKSSIWQEVFLVIVGVPGVLASIYLFLTTPIWYRKLSRNLEKHKAFKVHVAALGSVLLASSFLTGVGAYLLVSMFVDMDFIMQVGKPTFWSVGLYLSTLIYGVVSLIAMALFILWFKHLSVGKNRVLVGTVTSFNFIVVCYLHYWGLIGFQSWAY